ncbi:MAG: cytidylate kinase [Candidatus Pelagibacter sp. TMED142]|nr:MAG: cytidylate kinase [Candidatus Pelagibacter sp. TMED142]
MKKRKNIIKVAIDSPAASGAGTLAKSISEHYKLLNLDTGKIYRFIGRLKIKNRKNFTYNFIKKKIKNLKIKNLKSKNLLNDEVAQEAAIISKDKRIRKLVHNFQIQCAYNPPKNYKGSCLDGRDITYKIMPDADFKFYITASLKARALRRFKELKRIDNSIKFRDVFKSVKKRDKSDKNRNISKLKKTKDSILINTTNLTKKACFLKIKNIMDRKINN